MKNKDENQKPCQYKDCFNPATTHSLCRLHYLKYWKQIKLKSKKKTANASSKNASPEDQYYDIMEEVHKDDYQTKLLSKYSKTLPKKEHVVLENWALPKNEWE